MIINYSDQEVIKNKKSIFLAGPTPINNLDELLKESVLLSNTLYEGKTFEILPLSERKILKKK